MPAIERNRSVLVIDDDSDVRAALCELLEIEGYEATGAEDGQAALERLNAGARPGLILLDLMMPRMNGREFCAHLRQDPELGAIPVIVVTGSPQNAPPDVVDMLIKPIARDILLQKIVHLMPGTNRRLN
jgi:CheY-like chemotaxis protein